MDQTLHESWRRAEAPFNATTVFLRDPVALDVLLEVLRQTTSVLEALYPASGLRQLDDYHEHDGVVLPSSDATWNDLRCILESIDSFKRAVSDDDYVALGIYDTGRRFYLRFGFAVSDLVGTYVGPIGWFDLSAERHVCDRIIEAIPEVETAVMPTKAYFDDRAADLDRGTK